MCRISRHIWLMLPLAVACSKNTTEPAVAPGAVASGAPASAAEIESLIEQLALSQEPAWKAPILSPSRDTPRTDKRVVVLEAGRKLRGCGQAAFPYLLKHLHDNRQSMAFRRVLPSTVGDACFCIMREQMIPLPSDYEGSFYRPGADGRDNERPFFSRDLFDPSTIETWLEARRDKSLEQMQVETLKWMIQEEKTIGFRNEQDKQDYLYPLERQLQRIRASTQPKP